MLCNYKHKVGIVQQSVPASLCENMVGVTVTPVEVYGFVLINSIKLIITANLFFWNTSRINDHKVNLYLPKTES